MNSMLPFQLYVSLELVDIFGPGPVQKIHHVSFHGLRENKIKKVE